MTEVIITLDTYTITVTQTGGPGPKGDTGAGVPLGGDTGQIIVKKSPADGETEWQEPFINWSELNW